MDSVSDVAALPPPTLGCDYALRAVVVADSLDDLRGPLHGEVRLPLHLDASARQRYDLDQDYFRHLVYRLVLLEAATVEDLATWLDTLVRGLARVVPAARSASRWPVALRKAAGSLRSSRQPR